jgi:hypothetical protein
MLGVHDHPTSRNSIFSLLTIHMPLGAKGRYPTLESAGDEDRSCPSRVRAAGWKDHGFEEVEGVEIW